MAQTPQEAIGGVGNQVIANNGTFSSAERTMDVSETSAWYAWLPLWNTIILLSSSVTVHIAHLGLLDGNKKKFNLWLGITVLLGIIFVGVQAYEYYEAYAHSQSDTNESTQTQPETRGQRVLITPQSVSSAPARDPPGVEPNSAQQRPNPYSE